LNLFITKYLDKFSLSIIIIISCFFRLFLLTEQGFVEYDESWLIESAAKNIEEIKRNDLMTYQGFKSSHTTWLTLMLSFQLFGINSYSIQLPFAIYGILNVLLTYKICDLLYNKKVALLAALFLSISPLSITYSRSVCIEPPGIFFLLLSILTICYAMKNSIEKKNFYLTFIAGIFSALSFTANYRILLYCSAILIIIPFIKSRIKKLPLHYLLFFSGFLLILVLWDILLKKYFLNNHGYFHSILYADENFIRQGFKAGDKAFNSSSILNKFSLNNYQFYYKSIRDLGNYYLILNFLLLYSILVFFRLYVKSDVIIFSLIILPAMFFQLLIFKAPRAIAPLIPLLCICSARLTTLIYYSKKSKYYFKFISILIFSLTLINSISKSLEASVTGRSNAFNTAFKEVKNNDGVIVILDRFGPSYYANLNNVKLHRLLISMTLVDLISLKEKGYKYLLIDGQASVYKHMSYFFIPILEKIKPEKYIPADSYIRLSHFIEHCVYLKTSYKQELDKYNKWIGTWGKNLPLYNLEKIVKPLNWDSNKKNCFLIGEALICKKSTYSNEVTNGKYYEMKNLNKQTNKINLKYIYNHDSLPMEGGIGLCNKKSTNCYKIISEIKKNALKIKILMNKIELKTLTLNTSYRPKNTETQIKIMKNKIIFMLNKKIIHQETINLIDKKLFHPTIYTSKDTKLEAILDIKKL